MIVETLGLSRYGCLRFDAGSSLIDEERAERRITFHSPRHFLHAFFRIVRVPDPPARRMTGHPAHEGNDRP